VTEPLKFVLLDDVAIHLVERPAVLTETVPDFTFLFNRSVTEKLPAVASMKLNVCPVCMTGDARLAFVEPT
jgi:hypothetical protein